MHLILGWGLFSFVACDRAPPTSPETETCEPVEPTCDQNDPFPMEDGCMVEGTCQATDDAMSLCGDALPSDPMCRTIETFLGEYGWTPAGPAPADLRIAACGADPSRWHRVSWWVESPPWSLAPSLLEICAPGCVDDWSAWFGPEGELEAVQVDRYAWQPERPGVVGLPDVCCGEPGAALDERQHAPVTWFVGGPRTLPGDCLRVEPWEFPWTP